MAMSSRFIIERLDIVGYIRERKLTVFVDVLFDPFFLQATEEGFGYRVVPAVTFAAHARGKSVGTTEA